MHARHVFNFRSEDRRRPLPSKLLLVQRETETLTHILLKLFGFLLFYRDRLQLEPSLDDDYLPFTPDLVQFDYEGRIALWVECGECSLRKLDRLAVKAPDAELWAVKRSSEEATRLTLEMKKEGLRPGRYGVVGLDADMLAEVGSLCHARNDITWYGGQFDPARMQFDFNGLWFEAEFVVLKY